MSLVYVEIDGIECGVRCSFDGPDESVGLFGYVLTHWEIEEIEGEAANKTPGEAKRLHDELANDKEAFAVFEEMAIADIESPEDDFDPSDLDRD